MPPSAWAKTTQTLRRVDEDGVALAAIQGLNQKVEEQSPQAKDAEIQDLKARLEKLEQVLETRKRRRAMNTRMNLAVPGSMRRLSRQILHRRFPKCRGAGLATLRASASAFGLWGKATRLTGIKSPAAAARAPAARYQVNGTIGQPDAGGPMTGSSYSLTGGFWSLISVVQTAGRRT